MQVALGYFPGQIDGLAAAILAWRLGGIRVACPAPGIAPFVNAPTLRFGVRMLGGGAKRGENGSD